MMDMHSAIEKACAEVGIVPPRDDRPGQWIKTDTLSGRNGKGDGRVMIDVDHVVAWNWQTGEKVSVRAGDMTPAQRTKAEERIRADRSKQRERAERAADVAERLLKASALAAHPYLAGKGFPAEAAPTVTVEAVREIGGKYLAEERYGRAIVLPARVGNRITSAQLIWPDGVKRFLAGGRMDGAAIRLATGRDTWLCEGFATGLSLRTALRLMGRRDAILCCFSAYSLSVVAKTVRGRCWIAADHDKPLEQFEGLGTGEHYAKASGHPYALPPTLGHDINDLHLAQGIYAVQRLLGETIRKGTSA